MTRRGGDMADEQTTDDSEVIGLRLEIRLYAFNLALARDAELALGNGNHDFVRV